MFSQACFASFHLVLFVTSFNQLEPDCVKPAEEENINMNEICHMTIEAHIISKKKQGPGQTGLSELPTTISKHSQKYYFAFIL